MIATLASSAVEAAAPEWEELAERVHAGPFLRPGWISAWWRAFGQGQLELRCERRPADGRLSALVPLVRARGTLASPTNWHSPEFGLLADSPADARRLCAAVLADGPRSRRGTA